MRHLASSALEIADWGVQDQFERFLTELYAPATESPLFFCVKTLPIEIGHEVYRPLNEVQWSSLWAEIKPWIAAKEDAYFALPLYKESRRAAGNAALITAIWVDFDFVENKPAHGKHYPSKAEVLDLLDGLCHRPSAIVFTGGGVHAYWFLGKPLAVSPDTNPVVGVQSWFRRKLGRDVDVTGDLARIMRLPGTWNWKGARDPSREVVPVTLQELHPHRRYAIEDLVSGMSLPPQELPRSRSEASFRKKRQSLHKEIQQTPLTEGEITLIASAKKYCRNFAELWRGHGRQLGYPSQSEADLALCQHLAHLTGGNHLLVERLFGFSGLAREKWFKRRDYRSRTIVRALKKPHRPNETSHLGNKLTGKSRFDALWHGRRGALSGSAYRLYVSLIGLEKRRKWRHGSWLFLTYAEIAYEACLSTGSIKRAAEELVGRGLIEFEVGLDDPKEKIASEFRRILPIPKPKRQVKQMSKKPESFTQETKTEYRDYSIQKHIVHGIRGVGRQDDET